MKISIIVAMDNNGLIGVDNRLPWHLPNDLKRFKDITLGKAVLMGRKTFESILDHLGKPLPGRRNIVLTRQADYVAEGAEIIQDIAELDALAAGTEELMVIGGGSIYEMMLKHTDKLYITQVLADFDGDTYFPKLNTEDWILETEERHIADERHQHDYAFLDYISRTQ